MKKLTRAKARKVLHHKEVLGHPLTERQRKFFGARASGYPERLASGGRKLGRRRRRGSRRR